MFESSGRSYPVTYFRRLVVDLMHFSSKVPSAVVERPMNLAPLVAARRARQPSPSWSAIFTKAFAAVAAHTPPLRAAYLKFPRPRFYENAINVATLHVERQVGEERVVLYAHVPSPEKMTLPELDAVIRSYRQDPVETLLPYRRAVRMSRVPWPLRRWLWWAGLNMVGAIRCHNFGTFAISSVGAMGASLLHVGHPLLTSEIHYGMFDDAGNLAMRLAFDHRVLDGATAARALVDMEDFLLGDILHECMTAESDGTRPAPAFSTRMSGTA